MNRRDKIRQRRRRQRQRQVIRQYLAVGGAVLALVLVIFCVHALFGKEDKKAEDKTIEAQAAGLGETDGEASVTPSPTPTQEPPVTLTVSAAGDCTLGTDENFDRDTSFKAMYESVGDPSYFFRNVAPVLSQDDLTIVNLEGPLTTSTDRQDKTFAFKGDPEYTSILTSGSVEAVNLANNHSRDYGVQSYQDTIAHVEAAGIVSFGYDRTAIMDIKGVRVGLAGIYELAEGLECQTSLKENIAKLKTEGAQLIIVSFHWGTEKENYPDDTQKTLAHMAIDEGAHLVVGHHPHVLQGIEEYKGRNIVYSLGNFCFGGNKNPSDKDTMIFQQTFTVQGGAVQMDNTKNIIPCSLSSSSNYNDYQPTILEGEEKQDVLDRITTYSSGLSSQ